MNHLAVTISREYGSGGRLIGELVAQRLNAAFYNHNVIDRIAHESGQDRSYISRWGRQISSPGMWNGFLSVRRDGLSSHLQSEYYSNMGRMFTVQSRIIQTAAEEGPCVFVGRCAGYLLRNHAPALHVLIHASRDSRLRRVEQDYRVGGAPHVLEAVDRGRKSYYEEYTGQVWGDCHNYDLILDSGTLGIEGCAALILSAVHQKRKR